jgi:hypothetical protein
MARPTPTQQFNLIRGDKFDGPELTFTDASDLTKDWNGVVITAKLKDKPDGGTLIHTYTLSPTVVPVGSAVVTLTIPGTITAGFDTGVLYGDVQIAGPGDFGPYTPYRYTINVTPDITS